MFKLTLEIAGESAYKWIVALCSVVEHVTGEGVKVIINRVTVPGAEANRARIQYRALGTSEALQALGSTTVIGLIYTHILEHGPCTVLDIRKDRFYGAKSVESSIHKLRHMGLVQAEPITT